MRGLRAGYVRRVCAAGTGGYVLEVCVATIGSMCGGYGFEHVNMDLGRPKSTMKFKHQRLLGV